MRTVYRLLSAVVILAGSLSAGALVLQIGDASGDREAQANNAVLLARITACHSPEKTTITATAEGMENGVRRSIPLNVIRLTTAGTFAIARGWPERGTWAVELIARNPEYKDYATGVLVPSEKNMLQLTAAKHFFHAPTDTEVTAMIEDAPVHARNSIN